MISDDDVAEPGEPTSAARPATGSRPEPARPAAGGGGGGATEAADEPARASAGAARRPAPAEPAPDPPTPAGRRRAPVVAAVAVVVALAAGALALVQALRAGDATEERDALSSAAAEERDARLAAARFGEVFFTYDHRDVEAPTAALLELVTDDYARAFEEQRLPGVSELFASTELSTTGTAEEVFLGEIRDGAVRATVVLDVLATGQLDERTLDGLTLLLDLREADGRWLVDAVQLPRTRILGPDGQPITAVPTTTPAG